MLLITHAFDAEFELKLTTFVNIYCNLISAKCINYPCAINLVFG